MSQSDASRDDFIVFRPGDVDLARSPLRRGVDADTYVLGAFNPGFTRLPNGNLLLMVRIAEALRDPFSGDSLLALRGEGGRFLTDRHPRAGLDESDPRAIRLKGQLPQAMVLTSLSWLLPVELSADGSAIHAVHYDRAIVPERSFQQYGVEDPRITRIGDVWYMTTCSVSAERHCTTLHVSRNGLDYDLVGVILDHQNKDMVLFEGKVGGRFMALTRPMGDSYFAYPPGGEYVPGPAIQLGQSPDALHWKPLDAPGIRARIASGVRKVGGGAQPVLTEQGWLVLYHGVLLNASIGAYRTFWALLDRDDPTRILRLEDAQAVLVSRPDLTANLEPLKYVRDVVFTTGLVDAGDHWLVASGEDDLCCRLTRLPKSVFN